MFRQYCRAGCSVEHFALAKISQPETNNNVCVGSCFPHFSRRVQCLHHRQPSSRLQVATQVFQRMESTNEFVHMNILTSSCDNIWYTHRQGREKENYLSAFPIIPFCWHSQNLERWPPVWTHPEQQARVTKLGQLHKAAPSTTGKSKNQSENYK